MPKIENNKIWAIAGGKGGVGKSLISSNLSVNLAKQGYNVVLIDADFGGSNLHTFLGVNSSKISLSDFIRHPELKLEDILLPTGIPNLRLASGAHDVLGMARPNAMQVSKLVKAIKSMHADYVLIDLGAGSPPYILDLFLIADTGILVSAPEPTSVENTYLFVKSAFYRKLRTVIQHPEVRGYLEWITENKDENMPRTPADLISKITKINRHAGDALKYEISQFVPKLILNQIRTPSDARIGFSMRQACAKHFGISLSYVGFIEQDNAVIQSIRLRKPALLYAPESKASCSIDRIAQNLRQDYHLIPT
ncbi:MAG: ATP-binding protein [SAR324 cluster bacterium]|uniref:ATP-binding protein n=1 Tax=SAR324 cluster bacterium TaxID=2024889 RepID=A0A2A4T8M2_9DELT|nr:MAG: ATP-binding protein [SAR324 cluster bacterium]